jgi:hypothetical protein
MTLRDTTEMAGFFAAHAIWCVSDGETLTPIVAHPDGDGKRVMNRIQSEDSRTAVALTKESLAGMAKDKGGAVLLYDSFVTLGSWRTDSIMVEIVADAARMVMAVPYRHSEDKAGFAVFRPKFVECSDTGADYEALSEAFFRGVDSHENGSAVWSKHLDQSR